MIQKNKYLSSYAKILLMIKSGHPAPIDSNLSTSYVYAVINRMMIEGLVLKARDPKNLRSKIITLTPVGKGIQKALRSFYEYTEVKTK